MAKKFGKFLLVTAAVGTAAAAAYYLMQKKDSALTESDDNDEDYDDFSTDFDEEADATRNYVPLNLDNAAEDNGDEAADADDFTPLTEQLEQYADNTAEEAYEEFFDEEDTDAAE